VASSNQKFGMPQVIHFFNLFFLEVKRWSADKQLQHGCSWRHFF